MEIIRACKCGCNRFTASQKCFRFVVVDENNDCLDEGNVYDSEEPFGAYYCSWCSRTYESLDELPIFVSLPADVAEIKEYAKSKGFPNPVLCDGVWPKNTEIGCIVVENQTVS